jgi:hypothetical protein
LNITLSDYVLVLLITVLATVANTMTNTHYATGIAGMLCLLVGRTRE